MTLSPEAPKAVRGAARPFWLALALVYLFEAWVWDHCVALGRAIVTLIPWAKLKAAIVAMMDGLPAPFALVVFLIPVAIIEPFKIICLGLIAHGHWALGILGFIGLKFIGFGLIAVVFDLTKHRLLTMKWFVWVYEKFVALHEAAHRLVEPYKAAAVAAAREFRGRATEVLRRFRLTWTAR